MKRDLLDMVQEIQSDLDLDEIESIWEIQTPSTFQLKFMLVPARLEPL